ncbi:MAG: helix-turn-helix transcriptional regulator [Pseudolabrys sp.]
MANIPSGNAIAAVAALLGDAARANMLSALMGGQALTAGELARHAGVTAQTTSGHLAKLADARLIAMEKQGRHRYYRLFSAEIADAIHALMAVAAAGPNRHRPPGPRDQALRTARTCYDHMAGRLAVSLADAFRAGGYIALSDGAALITDDGRCFFCDFGIDLDATRAGKRPLCRTCLDWSERRPHLAGQFGARLLDRLLDLKWVVRKPDTRALRITPTGDAGLVKVFGLSYDWCVGASPSPSPSPSSSSWPARRPEDQNP